MFSKNLALMREGVLRESLVDCFEIKACVSTRICCKEILRLSPATSTRLLPGPPRIRISAGARNVFFSKTCKRDLGPTRSFIYLNCLLFLFL